MTQKTALILSVVLTAFVLVLGVGLAARVSQPAAPVEAAPVSAPAAPAPAATIDVNAQVEQLLQQREAQYRQLIEEANQRLQQANRQLAASAAAAPAARPVQSAASTAPAAPAASAAQAVQPTASLSTEAAQNIAIDASGGATMIRGPELVLFEGKVAYEVSFTRGAVYVDANDGTVLYNGTHGNGGQPSGGTHSQPQPTNGEHESEHEDSHSESD